MTTGTGAPAIDPGVGRLIGSALGLGVRTPLHSMLGFCELLAMTRLTDDQRRLLAQTMECADSLVDATGRLGLLMRALAGEPPADPSPFSLHQLVREVTTAGSPREVVVKVSRELPRLYYGDADRLRQVLTELVDNAVRHGKPVVTLTVEPTGPVGDRVPVRFTVFDNGGGLPADCLARFNAAVAITPDEPQQVGLYLVRQLTIGMGGQVTATNPRRGGAEVSIEVSLDAQPELVVPDPIPEPVPAPTTQEPRPIRVLLVEDNAVNRLLAQRQMTRLGHALETVSTGEAAVATILAGEYDLVLMDRHLPDIDGTEATRRIREAEASGRAARRTAIIAVTADAGAGHREECLAAGMDGFLTKPLDIDRLSAAITEYAPGTASPVDTAVTVTDPTVLRRLVEQFDGDGTMVAELVETFLNELPSRRLRLHLALRRGLMREAVVAAESMRTSSLAVGAVVLAGVCGEVRSAAEHGDFDASHELIARLLDACQRTDEELTAALAR